MGLFSLFFPCLCGGQERGAEQALGLGGLQCTLALQHNHHLLFPPKRLGNSTWKHTGRRDRDTAAASCGVPVPGMEGEGQVVCLRYNVLSLFPRPGCRQVLQLSPGGAEPSGTGEEGTQHWECCGLDTLTWLL